jgi:hypothetical protein
LKEKRWQLERDGVINALINFVIQLAMAGYVLVIMIKYYDKVVSFCPRYRRKSAHREFLFFTWILDLPQLPAMRWNSQLRGRIDEGVLCGADLLHSYGKPSKWVETNERISEIADS